ncbi:MAG: DNA-directed RNA polymerase subunit H [Candidatus Micrarchaeota archaeon]|nr:DNA-directed RNA polymerase subunit H [Candidatus Micrarchaeota archaeon]MCX8154607.1 DNA-directed RNA polymerase subunit H [Candidatus Micrarchaeota archaeon]
MKDNKTVSKLKINPIGHFLIGGARVLDEREKEELLKRLNTDLDKLPKILKTDPVVLALGAKEGDVLEFQREDYGIKYTYYRVVIGERYELPNE